MIFKEILKKNTKILNNSSRYKIIKKAIRKKIKNLSIAFEIKKKKK